MADEVKSGTRIARPIAECLRRSRRVLTGGMILVFGLYSHAQDQLCFPNTVWFGGASGPNLGTLNYNDPGWIGSFRYVFGNGTSTPFAVAQGIRDGSNNLFLSFEGRDLSSLTPASGAETSVIVIAFDFRSSGGSLYRIVIHPVFNAPAAPPTVPSGIAGFPVGTRTFSTGAISASGMNWTMQPTPAWLDAARVGYWGTSGDYNWFLAFEIPNTAFPGTTLATGSTFNYYFNIFRTVSGDYEESWWPQTRQLLEPGCTQDEPIGDGCTPNGAMPNPDVSGNKWGAVTIGPSSACGGVSITSQNNSIFTNNTPNSKICLINSATASDGTVCPANPNIFSANVHNSLVDSSGVTVPAPNVQATFSIANFGLQAQWDPSQWTQVSVGNNPTSAMTLTAADTTLSTNSWFPVSPNQSLYSTPQGQHQCILVQLDSTSGNVNFLNNAAIQNMDVVHASKFMRTAEISGKGYDPSPDNPDGSHNYDQVFDLHLVMHEDVLQPGQAQNNYPSSSQKGTGNGSRKRQVVSQLTWIAEGCRHTGRYMFEQGQKLEVCDPVGAFGYNIAHVGNEQVADWHISFTGQSMQVVPGQPNTYRVHVPQGGVAEVTTEGRPEELNSAGPGRWAVFLDAGVATPHGVLGNAYNAGFSLNAGLEYIVTRHFSAEAIFGYQHFPGKLSPNLNLYQYAMNAKVYLFTGKIQPFVNGGPGGYSFVSAGSSSTYAGGNAGAGILFNLSRHLGIQAAYNFNAVGTSGAISRFSAYQGEIRYAF